jgi:bifunctional non-homologous end joining protein LigD
VASLEEVEPMEFIEVAYPFDEPGWTAEIKYDGYRLLVEVDGGRVRIKTRRGADATRWYPELQTLGELPGRHILDGEGCYLDETGRAERAG